MNPPKSRQPPTIIIQPQDGSVTVRSNLGDPLATAMYLGAAVSEWARQMGEMRKRAVVGPDGQPVPTEG